MAVFFDIIERMIWILNLINWFFGFGFLLVAITLIKDSLIGFLISLIISLFLIPKSFNLIKSFIPNLTNKKRYILVFILFFVSMFFYPKAPPKQNIKKTINNKNEKVLSSSVEKKVTPSKIPSITPLPINLITPTLSFNNNENKGELYRVINVIDGDTIDVEINGKKERVRLIGINTPETVDPRKKVECFGVEASNKAKSILYGQSVYLEFDPSQGERDKYNRLLRYVFLPDGTNFNLSMIKEGYAYEYTYNLPYKYQKEFKEAERYARENKIGLWADDACLSNTSNTSQNNINSNTGSFVCNCAKSCSQMSSCEEAYFQLNNCGCSNKDSDGDGIPCEKICR